CELVRAAEPFGRELRSAELTDLALFYKLVEGSQVFELVDLEVIAMRVVEIDVVGTQPSQGLIDRSADVSACEPEPIRLPAHFRCDHDAVAVTPTSEPVPDDRLALTTAVARDPRRVRVGGIDHPSAGVYVCVEDAEARRLVRSPPEHASAEDERS